MTRRALRHKSQWVPLLSCHITVGIDVWLHSFLASALDGRWQPTSGSSFTLRKEPPNHRIRGWVDPMATLEGNREERIFFSCQDSNAVESSR
jgi:hypothetical protein